MDTGAWWAVVPNTELSMTECAHSTSCLVLLHLPCMFWGHLLASIYYDLLRSPCQGLTHLYPQHLMHLTLPSLCLRTSAYLNQSPLQNTSAQTEHTRLSQVRGAQWMSSPCSQPPCSSSDHHCWCLGCNPISPFRLRYSDDQPSYYGGDSPEGESRVPCLSWDCHILALPLKSWKNHFFSGPLSNLWNDQRTVLLLRRFNRVQLSATP